MKINVYGLGYVGCVTAACLANDGHQVVGFDIDAVKVELINQGRSPISEKGLDRLIDQALRSGNLQARRNQPEAADMSVICVGTPSREDGNVNLEHVRNILRHIARYPGNLAGFHVINIRSTVAPGSLENDLIPLLQRSAKMKVGKEFGMCMNPEFLREGSSVYDYYHPPFTVIGASDPRSGEIVAGLYQNIQAPLFLTAIKVAEMVKYACNAFHALKVTFANEIGNFCKQAGVDSHEVMDIFCQDTKLNLSPYYLKPGFAFGGSCLPKDLRALVYQAGKIGVDLPVIQAILPSNRRQIERAFQLISQSGNHKIGLVGLSFKSGTDDLRESPLVELAEKMIRKGFQVSIYDREISPATLIGANRRYIESVIPQIPSLLKESLEALIADAEVVVFGKPQAGDKDRLRSLLAGKRVIDLVRLFSPEDKKDFEYEGICW